MVIAAKSKAVAAPKAEFEQAQAAEAKLAADLKFWQASEVNTQALSAAGKHAEGIVPGDAASAVPGWPANHPLRAVGRVVFPGERQQGSAGFGSAPQSRPGESPGPVPARDRSGNGLDGGTNRVGDGHQGGSGAVKAAKSCK